jgi:hypothetical protein
MLAQAKAIIYIVSSKREPIPNKEIGQMPKAIAIPTEVWNFFEGITIYIVYAIAATALAHYGPDHLVTLLSANLPGLYIVAFSLFRESIENRRQQRWQI